MTNKVCARARMPALIRKFRFEFVSYTEHYFFSRFKPTPAGLRKVKGKYMTHSTVTLTLSF